jgi:predicted GIY-YIG superfamily endonuclease
MSYTIYCLLLENECYYVGRTTNLPRRLAEHLEGNSTAWTKLHPVIRLYAKKENCDALDEDKYVKLMMQKVGIDKVRGGSYSQINLSRDQISCLQRELNTANNKCFRCGSSNHFIANCPTNTVHKVKPKEESEFMSRFISALLTTAKNFFDTSKIP